MLLQSVNNYLKLGRMHSAVLLGLAPICTALTTGIKASLSHYFVLFVIGLFFHVFLFVLNEVRDVSVDKAAIDLSQKPLVEGSISVKQGWLVVVVSMIMVALLIVVFFYNQSFYLLGIAGLAFIFGGVYDCWGKRIPHADYTISMMIFLVALFGAFSFDVEKVSLLSLVVALLALFQMVMNNVLAGVKDVGHDFSAGKLSTPFRLGVQVENGVLRYSKRFVVYVALLKLVHIVLALSPFFLLGRAFVWWQLLILFIFIVVAVGFLVKLFRISVFKRERIMQVIGFHEIFAFFVVPVVLFEFVGFWGMVFLLVLPVLWLGTFLKMMYGRLMPVI